MHVRRPAHLRFEYRDSPEFSLQALLSAEAGAEGRWLASAAHFDDAVELDLQDLSLFQAVPEQGIDSGELEGRFGAERLRRLLAQGVLLGDAAELSAHAAGDATVRAANWWGPAAMMQRLGRWDGVDIAQADAAEGKRGIGALLEANGVPPPEAVSLCPPGESLPLPAPMRTSFDQLLGARATCRNFDADARVSHEALSTMLHRVFGAQASQQMAPGAVMLKKNSPSGGGLHAIEAYLLVQRVEGVKPGLYHYQCVQHALEPMRTMSGSEAAASAHELVAGQAWFANAPALLLMAARFPRLFWKYPNHAKAWKVVQLDAGHLSQNLYLSATELGYGAFITGAINDRCAERLFGLDGMSTGAIAVCGFGKRAETGDYVEFDPLGKAVR